ncbi:TPA: diphthamide biosynthesis enzyme Dph2 [Candidatus Bathyarchaeota archaeon]|nr:diphthamide biosynthesis enzyme Dph2 [Candidatus Bathyarchaeota archaeon]
MYDLKERELIRLIKERNARRIVLQFPEGLRQRAFRIARAIEEATGAEAVISADPCYGACDLAEDALRTVEGDLLVHYGHAEFPELNGRPVIFVKASIKIDVKPALSRALNLLGDKRRLGLFATVQHLSSLNEARKFLEGSGKEVFVGRASGRAVYDGQILGCEVSAPRELRDKVEGFVVISGGNFHGLGVQLATGKETVVVDPFLNEARELKGLAELTLKRRWAQILKFSERENVGVLVSLKTGQTNLKLARKVKKALEEKGRKCALICVKEITPENLDSFIDIEAFVNTGCPRVPIEDQPRFGKPILNPEETLIALGVVPWESYGRIFLERSAWKLF